MKVIVRHFPGRGEPDARPFLNAPLKLFGGRRENVKPATLRICHRHHGEVGGGTVFSACSRALINRRTRHSAKT